MPINPSGNQAAITSSAEGHHAEAASRLLLDQNTDKWSVMIVNALCAKPLRFNGIKRSLDGVMKKALTQSLRRLERIGMLARWVIPTSQVAVEYSITPLGRTLESPFRPCSAGRSSTRPPSCKPKPSSTRAPLRAAKLTTAALSIGFDFVLQTGCFRAYGVLFQEAS